MCISLSIILSSLLFFKFPSNSFSNCVNYGVLSCRGSLPIITSTTVEVVVPRGLVPVIYGEDGECLKQILQVRPLHLTIDDVNFVVFGWLLRTFVLINLNSCLSYSYMDSRSNVSSHKLVR